PLEAGAVLLVAGPVVLVQPAAGAGGGDRREEGEAVGPGGDREGIAPGEVTGGVGAATGIDPGHRILCRRICGKAGGVAEVGAVDPADQLVLLLGRVPGSLEVLLGRGIA